LRINNMDNDAHRYRITARGDYDFNLKGDLEVTVAGGEVHSSLLRLGLDPGRLREPNSRGDFGVIAVDDPGLAARQESRFIGPALRAPRRTTLLPERPLSLARACPKPCDHLCSAWFDFL